MVIIIMAPADKYQVNELCQELMSSQTDRGVGVCKGCLWFMSENLVDILFVWAAFISFVLNKI